MNIFENPVLQNFRRTSFLLSGVRSSNNQIMDDCLLWVPPFKARYAFIIHQGDWDDDVKLIRVYKNRNNNHPTFEQWAEWLGSVGSTGHVDGRPMCCIHIDPETLSIDDVSTFLSDGSHR